MTASPDAPRLAFADLADAIRALREAGLRLSTPRRLVLQALFAAEGPVSAAYLARELSIEESSVYRNLEALEQHGLVRHIHLGHSPSLYVRVQSEDIEYLYCERCAKVSALSPERLDAVRVRIRRELGYAVRFTHFAIVGVCEACTESASARASSNADHAAVDDPHDQHLASESGRWRELTTTHEHLHSHGDHVHSHPHAHRGGGPHQH